jgi:hypothetical protein
MYVSNQNLVTEFPNVEDRHLKWTFSKIKILLLNYSLTTVFIRFNNFRSVIIITDVNEIYPVVVQYITVHEIF